MRAGEVPRETLMISNPTLPTIRHPDTNTSPPSRLLTSERTEDLPMLQPVHPEGLEHPPSGVHPPRALAGLEGVDRTEADAGLSGKCGLSEAGGISELEQCHARLGRLILWRSSRR